MSELIKGAEVQGTGDAEGDARVSALRLSYQAPQVRRFGTVEDLTSAVSGAGADGGTASMAGG